MEKRMSAQAFLADAQQVLASIQGSDVVVIEQASGIDLAILLQAEFERLGADGQPNPDAVERRISLELFLADPQPVLASVDDANDLVVIERASGGHLVLITYAEYTRLKESGQPNPD